NSDGSLYKTTADGVYRYNGPMEDPKTGLPAKFVNGVTGGLARNHLESLLQTPMERQSIFGRGHMDLSERVTAFAQVLYSDSYSKTTFDNSPLLGGWRASAPHGEGLYEPSLDANGNTLLDYQAGGRFGLNCP